MSRAGDVIENPMTGERAVVRVLFGILAPVARLLGYRGNYPGYLERGPTERVEVEPWTNAL